jgi:hypothetical protein
MKICTKISIASLVILLASPTMADVKFSGFGSIVAGQTLNDNEILTADFYDVGLYKNTLTFKAESVLGLQMTAGRRSLPMYYYSEFSEVGYAYPWIRPPSNLYWWQVTQFNGIHASYDFSTVDYSNSITVFYGNEYSTNNKEMLYYAKLGSRQLNNLPIVNVEENWTDIIGFNINIIGDIFDARLVYFRNDRERIDTNTAGDKAVRASASGFSHEFFGIGGNVNIDNLTIIYDANYVKYDDTVGTVFPTYLISAVYNVDQYQPYVTYSKADHWQTESVNEKNYEEHYIASVGLRYNLSSKASAKLQYDHFEEEGDNPTGWDYHGNSRTVTAAVDFIF